ncbi:hypothetical protein [Sandaracinus amylolyticus]|uniref:RCC1 domain-containing protein n=1 Tax=Sandaracinus amylolyticus TaxID=927083 RepID=UPI001F2DD26A|nr:hypothetical protein [Sandaracinus amylolyticus]
MSGDGCSATCVPETMSLSPNQAARVRPAIAVDGRGAALVVWTIELAHEDAREIRAQRFEVDGRPIGGSLLVARIAGRGSDLSLAAAGRPEAGWAIAWSAAGADGDGLGVRAAFVSETGVIGGSFPVSAGTEANGDQSAPSVAWYADGLVVAYVDRSAPAENGAIGRVLVRAFDERGVPFAPSAELVSTANRPVGEPSLTVSGLDVVIAWSEGPDPNDPDPAFVSRVLLRRVGFSGLLAPLVVAEPFASSAALASLDTGDVVAAWVTRVGDPRGNIELRTSNAEGLGAPLVFASTGEPPRVRPLGQGAPVVAGLAQGRWLAAWEEEDGVATIAFAQSAGGVEDSDLSRLRDELSERSTYAVAMSRAPRGVWVAWLEDTIGVQPPADAGAGVDAGVADVRAGRALRVHLLPYPDLCRRCGGQTPICDAMAGECSECAANHHCPSLQGAEATCVDGVCQYACEPGLADCDGNETCETPLGTQDDCGACGDACSTTEECNAGSCECVPGTTRCDGTCQYLDWNDEHCGACGVSCAGLPGTEESYCHTGSCEYACESGLGDCDLDFENGCETDVAGSDPERCGSCGYSCIGQANAPYGECVGPFECMLECANTYGDCDEYALNGCETQVTTNVAHCGACGRDCRAGDPATRWTWTSASCSAGSCAFTCVGTRRNCDGDYWDGCEVDISSNAGNCGGCGISCTGRLNTTGGTCSAGTCSITCSGSYRNCDGDFTDGCEVNSATDALNCGACGVRCADLPHVTASTCASGTCGAFVCDTGWANCTTASGCETELGTALNCGSCGARCDWGCTGSSCNDAVSVSGGRWHTCAIRETGALVCWGYNASGRLGNGTTTSASTPVAVSTLSSGVTSVSAGLNHTCAVRTGAAWCWGSNASGQLGVGNTTASSTPVTVSGLGSGVVDVAAGGSHSCAVRSNGTVWCWGSNSAGQLGNGTANSTIPVQVTGITTATAIAVGNSHSCALLSTGAVRCWGLNSSGQLGDASWNSSTTPVSPVLFESIASISAGTNHSCAVATSGKLWCWGANLYGQLGFGDTVDRASPIAPLSSGVARVSAGNFHTCARLTTGAGRCWGHNEFGRLGDETETQSLTPTPVVGLSGISVIAAGGNHSCAVLTSGAIRCWGRNYDYELGDGTNINRLQATAVAEP